ncbi:threonine ammonia-lyase [Haloarchaeobius sp. TZWSO28]|uniref:threonine ammonia-lyase n=1 Tax=Haloarchaeobius sp. TZWSO28 TaxID=3446119 RepID=UPI003EC0F145
MSTNDDEGTVTAADVRAAAARLDDDSIVQRTPVEQSRSLSRLTGGEVLLKMEHLQRTGSFKTRGAYNKLRSLAGVDGVERVVAASAGNHAQGVALAATKTGVPSTVVMPRDAPQAKVDATAAYGADVVLEGTDFNAAVEHARGLAARDGYEFVHAFDDPAIVAGQGTLAIELLEQVPDVDTVVVPIGGGGLIGGMAAYLADERPDVRLVGVQAESAATVPASLDKGFPQSLDDAATIADGIATGSISDLTLELIQNHVDEVVTVPDADLARAVLLLLERAKQLVEGAGAAPVAALIDGLPDVAGETVVPVLSGGNMDMSMLDTILTYELTTRRQLLRLRVRIVDEPGRMSDISGAISDVGGNIRDVMHQRADAALEVGEANLVFLVETTGAGHARAVREAIEARGYEVERVN